jgi:hypothetical protein
MPGGPSLRHSLIKRHLVAKLLGCVVICLLIVISKEHLPNKVVCMRTTAEAAVDRQEVVNLCNHSNSSVVVGCVVIAQLSAINTKLLQCLVNNLNYPCACMGTCKLRKRNRQTCKLA